MNKKLEINSTTIMAATGIVAVILIGIITFNLYRSGYIDRTVTLEDSEETRVPPEFRHPLWGAWVYEAVERPEVYAVMVENKQEAWPHAGIEEAFFVIEAPVEGLIPRFMALYESGQNVEKIGPVRSARPYYLDWASPFGVLYAHVGGSPAAMEELRTTDALLDFDEIRNQYQFWRENDSRVAPHNVFTSTDLLAEGRTLRHEGAEVPVYGLWKFKDDLPAEERDVNGVEAIIPFGSLYETGWVYEHEMNVYERLQNGQAHRIEDGDVIMANNVVVMEVSMKVIDDIGRMEMETIGEGSGYLLQDGKLIEITWQKKSDEARLRFVDQNGTEVEMNAGKTWVEVVSDLEMVTIGT